MKKIAYILGYIGSICTILISILNAFVTYSYHLDQPTVLSQRSVISSIISIFLSILILILIHKLDFKKYSSSLLLAFTVIFSLILPGLLEYEVKLRNFPQYAPKDFYHIAYNIVYASVTYFPLILVLIAGILFIINAKKRQ